MSCAWVQERLLLYLSGELHGRQEERLLRHLEHCDACTRHAAVLAATHQKAEAALQMAVEPPEGMDARIMEALRRLPVPRRSRIPVLRWPSLRQGWSVGLAALSLLVGGFGVGRWSALRLPETVASPVALEFRTLGETHRGLSTPAASPGTDTPAPEELGRSLTPLVSFPVSVVDLQSDQTRLVGGSRQVVQGAPVACLRYEWQGKRISLFQMDARHLALPALKKMPLHAENYVAQRHGGFSYVAWSSGGVDCVLVSEAMPMHRLFQLACHACERQERLSKITERS